MNEIERLKKQLSSVRQAIEDIESGSQSFEIESNGARRKSTKVLYSDLMRREGNLSIQIKRLTRRGLQTLRVED